MTSTEAPGARNCVACGRAIGWDANVCPYCGHDYRIGMLPAAKPGTSRARVGGALILIAGILAILMGIAALSLSTMTPPDTLGLEGRNITPHEFQELVATLGVAAVVLGFVGVIGGIFALQKRHLGWAIVGGVAALLGLGFLVGAILALVGLLLVAMSKEEFGGRSPPSAYPLH